MKIDTRKRMLMMALICLLGFQPQARAHTVRFEVKFAAAIIALGALFNIRYVTDSVGACFKGVGDLLQSLARIKIFEEHKGLSAAKEQFDTEFKKFTSEQNTCWTNSVYAHISELNHKTLDAINIASSKSRHTCSIIGFLERNLARPDDKDFDYLSGRGYSYIPYQTVKVINSQLSSLDMEIGERNMFMEGIKEAKFANATDLCNFVTYATHSIKNYRRERNKKLITLCCAHLGCEFGTLEAVKPILIDKEPRRILEVFSAAAITRNSVNQTRETMTEISTDSVLMACKQS